MPVDSKTPGQRIIEAAEEALRFARGEDTGARVTVYQPARVQAIRKKLGFTQQEFAARFGVSLGTLRNWEQGARVPEGPARALLTIIDREPDAAKRALSAGAKNTRKKAKSEAPASQKRPARKRA
jgi:putative transcriptional regulator